MSEGEHAPTIPQEDDRVGGRRVTVIAVVSVVVVIGSIGVAAAIGAWTRGSLGRQETHAPARRVPREIGMVDQTLIEHEAYGETLRHQQRRVLDRYEWVDRGAGVARIPIDRAIDLVVQQEASP